MSLGQIIDYFRNELRNKLLRPNCQKQLTLWDHSCWVKSSGGYTHFILNANDFLQFWYRTCYELCCVNDTRAIDLKNALDKYFYFLLDFENYFNVLIERKIFKNRADIMQGVVNYNLDKNNLKTKIKRNNSVKDLFKELVNRVNEWNYWKKVILTQFIRINIGEASFQASQQNNLGGLIQLLKNTEALWDRGIAGNQENNGN